jgi:catechol 2,3-dioxygenase-like lactoylglutathione lyase family enzyme
LRFESWHLQAGFLPGGREHLTSNPGGELEGDCILEPHASAEPGGRVFDHVKFGVSDYAASRAFYLKALEPLGIAEVQDWPPNGVEIVGLDGASLCLYQSDEKPVPLHLAFVARSRSEVDRFYAAALQAGGRDNGPPGLRPQYSGRYYAAFVIGPDGHNIEAVFHEPEV